MRISFVSGSYPPILCGIGDYLDRLSSALAGPETQVHVLTSVGAAADRPNGVAVEPVVEHWGMASLPRVLSHLRAARPDVVDIQYPTQRYGRGPMVNLLPLFIRARLHVPVVTTVHEYSTYHRLGKIRVALAVLASDAVIVPDSINLAQIARALQGARSKLHNIPLGAIIEPAPRSDEERQRRRALYGATDKDLVAAFFGFVSPSKGIETLLGAFQRAVGQSPDAGLRLWLIANREPAEALYSAYHRRVEELIQKLGLGDRLFWTGYLPPNEVSMALTAADLAVLPFADGASLRRTTLLAALAHGLPVISTRPSASVDARLNEENGVTLVPVGDEEALAQALVGLVGDAASRRALSARARRFAAGFAWPNIAAQTRSVLERVCEI